MSIIRWSDIREAARGLSRAPAVTISAVLCLALGLGATTAISGAIDAALVQSLPFRQPGRLLTVYRTTPQFDTGPHSAPNYLDLAAGAHQITGLSAVTYKSFLMTLPDAAERVAALRVTGGLFGMLGAQAAHGRLLTPADDQPGAPPVMVISDELWRTRFGSDPSTVGRSVLMDGESRTVVGILPPRFRVPHGASVLSMPVWVPMQFSSGERSRRSSNYLMAMGRLADGATIAGANAELRGLFNGLAEAYPDLEGEQVRVLPMQAEGVRAVRTPLLLLGGAVLFVLLIAATNVASLLLARGVQRRREMAIRTALGGDRWAVMRPVVAESLLLTGTGVLLGLGLAWLGIRTVGALAVARLPQLATLGLDWRVAGFAIALSAVVAVLCGALPAWRSASVDPQEALRGGRGAGAGRSHHRALGTLVAAEVALSLVLMLGAGLVLKGFASLISRDPGFDPSRLLTLNVTISPQTYPDQTAVARFLEPALEAIRQVPGVEQAAAINLVPYDQWGWNFNVRYEGQPEDNRTQQPLVERRQVTPEFFAVTGQRLIAGRLLQRTDDERDEAPAVVVVNEALVRRDLAGQDPIGKRFYRGGGLTTIVGVVSDIRNFGPARDPRPEIYVTYRQGGLGDQTFPLMIRTRGVEPATLVRPVTDAIRALDPGAAITGAQPMADLIGSSVGRPRFYLSLLGVFAGVALVLAMAGLYGVMSYTVAQRTREIGIRTALGSSPAATVRHIAGRGLRLIAAGTVAGLAGAFAATRLLQSLLYGVSPLDRSTWLLTTLALAGAGVLATLLPARRAARVDPLIAMQAE